MLEFLRKQKRGVFGFVIIAFCAALMLPFGLDMIRNSDQRQDSAIKVGETKIEARQFYNRLQQIQENYRSQLRENYNTFKKMLNLEQRTVDDLVHGVLIDKFVETLGLGVSVLQIEEKIASHPFFKDTGITKSSFDTFLRAQGLNSAALESITKKQIAVEQIENLFGDFTIPSKKEEVSIKKTDARLVKFKYLEFKPEKFKAGIKIEDKEKLKTYFKEHSEDYLTKKSSIFSVVTFSPNEFLNQVEVDQNEVREAFENDQSEYFNPAQVKIKQYVVNKDRFSTNDEQSKKDGKEEDLTAATATAKEYINKASEKLKAGEEFDKVVGQDSDQTVDAGWIDYRALEPEVRAAASNLEVGKISEVIELEKYFKIIKIEDKKEKTKRNFEEVKSSIETKIKTDNAPEYARAAAENFMNKVAGAKLSEVAESNGKKSLTTPNPISIGETLAGVTPNAIKQILSLQEGSLEIINDGDVAYLAQVIKVNTPEVPAFEKVEQQVNEALINKEAAEQAKKAAEQAKETIFAGTSFEEVAKLNNIEIAKSDFIAKDKAATAPFSIDVDKRKALALNASSPVAKDVFQQGETFYVVGYDEEKQDTEKKQEIKFDEVGANRLFESLIKYLKSKTEIKVDPSLLEENS